MRKLSLRILSKLLLAIMKLDSFYLNKGNEVGLILGRLFDFVLKLQKIV
jgi:hypothetical protein